MLGVALYFALVLLGPVVAVNSTARQGAPPDELAFLAVSTGNIVAYTLLFGAALHWRRRPDVHKRLMLLGMVADGTLWSHPSVPLPRPVRPHSHQTGPVTQRSLINLPLESPLFANFNRVRSNARGADGGQELWHNPRNRPPRLTRRPLYAERDLIAGVIGHMANLFTELQGQYLAYIATYTKLHRRPPAEADLQEYFRVTPPSVHNMILNLEKRRLIARTPGRARSIEVLVPRNELPALE